MKRIFSLRRKKPRNNRLRQSRKQQSHNQEIVIKRPASSATTMSPRQMMGLGKPSDMAEALLLKMPPVGDFHKTLNSTVYEKSFEEANKDVLRLIRRVTIVKKNKGFDEQVINFNEGTQDIEIPDDIRNDGNLERVYLFMKFLSLLLEYFETDEIAQNLNNKMNNIFQDDRQNFTVLNLIEAIGGQSSRAALVAKCLGQSVAISGHLQIKSRVCAIPTKDVAGDNGWRIRVTLAEYVQIKHSRREVGAKVPGISTCEWEMEYDVHLTFDKNMTEITAANLSITDLVIPDEAEQDLKEYLGKKFGYGSLVIY